VRPSASLPVQAAACELSGGNRHDPKWHAKDTIQAVALVADHPIALHDMEIFLKLLQRVAGPKLLGLTGLVALADDPDRPLLLHSGAPAIYPLRRLARWPSGDRRTRMIAITRGLDPAILKNLFASVTGPSPDRMLTRVAMAASAALVMVFALGLGLALSSNARTAMAAVSTALWTHARGL
jgi:hypothetical protein